MAAVINGLMLVTSASKMLSIVIVAKIKTVMVQPIPITVEVTLVVI